jgi:hypothetical protein
MRTPAARSPALTPGEPVHPRSGRRAHILGTVGLVVALTGLTAGATLVALTTGTRPADARLPTWTVRVSYAVARLSAAARYPALWGLVTLKEDCG